MKTNRNHHSHLLSLSFFPHRVSSPQSFVFRHSADEHLAELMPIFERLRAQEQIPCAYPLQMGAGGTAFIRGGTRSTPLSPHAPHCHPSAHWVSFFLICGEIPTITL